MSPCAFERNITTFVHQVSEDFGGTACHAKGIAIIEVSWCQETRLPKKEQDMPQGWF